MTEEKPKAGLRGSREFGLDFLLEPYPSPLYAHFLALLLPASHRLFLSLSLFPIHISFPLYLCLLSLPVAP